MTRILAALIAFLTITFAPSSMAANSTGTDLSDMWWNPAESGWGVNITHQRDIIFLTVYVYGPDNRVKWYVASSLQQRAGVDPPVYDGVLLETTGPFFGAPVFDPAGVAYRTVGTATLTKTDINRATLRYSVDGVEVFKTIERQTFRENNLFGAYFAGISRVVRGCVTGNGGSEEALIMTIYHDATNAITLVADSYSGSSCEYAGAYTQYGRMGRATGSVTCTTGTRGAFDIYEIETGPSGFLARYTTNYGNGCIATGTMAGLKR